MIYLNKQINIVGILKCYIVIVSIKFDLKLFIVSLLE